MAMNVAEAIARRRAIRAYTSERVDDTTIRALLRAAVQAPSAMNRQPWIFAIVQDAAQLARWSARSKELVLARAPREAKLHLLHDPNFDVFYDATTLVVIGVEERAPYSEADCWLAAENLMLAACDAGLGTCCIGFALPFLNTAEAKREMSFPSDGAAVAAIIVGRPRTIPPPVPRNDPRIVSWSR